MATISQIIQGNNNTIRNKTLPDSIDQIDVANRLDAVANFANDLVDEQLNNRTERILGFAETTKVYSDLISYPKYDPDLINIYQVVELGDYNSFIGTTADPNFILSDASIFESNTVYIIRNPDGEFKLFEDPKPFSIVDIIEIGNMGAATSNSVASNLNTLMYGDYGTEYQYGTTPQNNWYPTTTTEFWTLRADNVDNEDRLMTNVLINVNGTGVINLAIGYIDSALIFRPITEFTISVIPGINTIPVNYIIPANHYLALKSPFDVQIGYYNYTDGISGSSMSFGFGYDHPRSDNNTINTHSYAFTAKKKDKSTIKIVTTDKFNELTIGELGSEIIDGSTSYNNTYPPDTNAYIRLREDLSASYDRLITAINIYTGSAGVITMAVGLIDQNYKFIQREQFTISVSAGENIVPVQQLLKAGEHLAIVFPTTVSIGFYVDPPNGNNTNFGPPIGSVGVHDTNNTFSYGFKSREIVSPPIMATKEELDSVQDDITELNAFKNSPTFNNGGDRVKLVFNTDGSVSWSEIGYTRVLHLGNSIAKHPITSYWWGEWGMAATIQANDYVHKFYGMLEDRFVGAASEVFNIAAWEVDHTTYNLSLMDSYFSNNPDLVVLRIGENVSNLTGFATSFGNLIDYILSKPSVTTLIVGGVFWGQTDKETIMQNVCASKGITYVSLSHLNISTNKSFIGDTVYDASGNPHTVNNYGVAEHPNDTGMLAIANALFNVV